MNDYSPTPRIAWTHQPVARRRTTRTHRPLAWPAWLPRLAPRAVADAPRLRMSAEPTGGA
jgi:hypothetical protein